MNKKTTVSAHDAARYLAKELGETYEKWSRRLVNWRRPERNRFCRIKWIDGPRPRYEVDVLAAFVADRKREAAGLLMLNVPNDAAAQLIGSLSAAAEQMHSMA